MSQALNPRGVSVPQYNQGDLNTAKLSLTITHQNTVMDLTGATIAVVFQKSDGTVVYEDTTNGVTVTDAVNGNLDIMLNAQTRAVPGVVTGAVRVTYPGNKIIETEKFTFNVEASLASDQAIASANDITSLVGTATLTTVAKDIRGAINEINANLMGLYNSTTSYTYTNGQLTQSVEVDSSNNVLKTTSYSYDPSTNKITQTVDVFNGHTVTTAYNYDASGNLASTTQTLS